MEVAQLIERVKARVSEAFLEAIEGFSGEELFAILGAIFSKVGERRVAKARARLVRDATGPIHATGPVTVHFSEATGEEAQQIPAGTVLFKTSWGVRYRLLEALTRASEEAAGDEVVQVEAEFAGWGGNVRAGLVNQWAIPDLNNPNSIAWGVGVGEDAREEFFARVRSGSITFTAGEMTGGRGGTLDLKARGRGIPRAEGESDVSLRRRYRTAPDMVTPDGIERAANNALGLVEGAVAYEYWDEGFAFGVSGFGEAPFADNKTVVLVIPVGGDVSVIETLLERIGPLGVPFLVLEASP